MPLVKVKIEVITVGFLATNCYLLYEEDSRLAALIDPGDEAGKIINRLERLKLTLKCIIHTHGHFDHTQADSEIKKTTQAQILIHQADALMLGKVKPDILLKSGDIIEIGKIKLKVIHTPGHTPGGICLATEEFIFTGDTLFQNAVGRTDLPGGNEENLWRSIREKLFPLSEKLLIYPGHGPSSTIGAEKKVWKN